MQETPGFSTCLTLAGKRLSSRTEIWQCTVRQYLIAPSAGMNYSSANNGAWCSKLVMPGEEILPLAALSYSPSSFLRARAATRNKKFLTYPRDSNGAVRVMRLDNARRRFCRAFYRTLHFEMRTLDIDVARARARETSRIAFDSSAANRATGATIL